MAVSACIMTTDGEVISTLVGWTVLIIALGLMPLTLLWILFKPLDEFHDPVFYQTYEPFFDNLSKNSKAKLSYILVFMIRRMLFMAVA